MNPLHPSAPFDGIADALPDDDLLEALPAGPRRSPLRRGWPVLAWLVIAGVSGFIIVRQAVRQGEPQTAIAESILTMKMQARYQVGVANLDFAGAERKSLYDQARKSLDQGSYSQRLRFVVVAGELIGPDEALDELKRLEEERKDGRLQARDVSVESARKLERLYRGYRQKPTEPSLPPADQEWLRSRLEWFGELALAPKDGDPVARAQAIAPALRTVVVVFSMLGLGLLALCAGGSLLLLFALLAVLGRLRGGLECGSGHGGIYAETFALYLVSFVGFSFAFRYVPVPVNLQLGFGTLTIFLVSLLVLVWPMLRGIPWSQVRADVGLHVDGNLLGQILSGFGCYLCAVPILIVGALIMWLMMFLQRRLGLGEPLQPTHPIVQDVLQGSPWVWVQIFLAACVAAPIAEEILFRGVLYRHLREASYRWGHGLSIFFSALTSSFVFAVIHPQGWLMVPPLMALAVVFCLAREWRRSLLPTMIAHGIHNGVITLMLLLTAA